MKIKLQDILIASGLIIIAFIIYAALTYVPEEQVVKTPENFSFSVKEIGRAGDYAYAVFALSGSANITLVGYNVSAPLKINVINDQEGVDSLRIPELAEKIKSIERYGYTIKVSDKRVMTDEINVVATGAMPNYILDTIKANATKGVVVYIGRKDWVIRSGSIINENWYDELSVSICYNNVDVKIHASHSGLNVGPDGASHQALEDIALVRSLPNMIVLSPCDFLQAKKATYAAVAHKGPVYIRTAREKSAVFTTEETPFEIGKANVYRDGDDVAIMAHGLMVYESLLAAEKLKAEGISAAVVDIASIKPLDRDTIIKYAKKTGFVFTVEEHQVYGGMGSAIAELLSQNYPTKMYIHGVYDSFGESGNMKELFRKYELDAEGIAKKIKSVLK